MKAVLLQSLSADWIVNCVSVCERGLWTGVHLWLGKTIFSYNIHFSFPFQSSIDTNNDLGPPPHFYTLKHQPMKR